MNAQFYPTTTANLKPPSQYSSHSKFKTSIAHSNGYMIHYIESSEEANDFYLYMQRHSRHPSLNDYSDPYDFSFATVHEARLYLEQLLDISDTFTMPPYAIGYLDHNLIAGPIELNRMQHLMNVANIQLSSADQALLYSEGFIEQHAFENQYLNQTVKILAARELIGAFTIFLTKLENCTTHFRAINSYNHDYQKLPFFRFKARAKAKHGVEYFMELAQRDCKNLKHVNQNRALGPLNALYGNVHYHYGYPFTYATPIPEESQPYYSMVWDYIGQSVDLSSALSEWHNGPLSKIGDATLLNTIHLHRLINHQLLVLHPHHSKDSSAVSTAKPADRLTPQQFAKHFPHMAHLSRFVGQNSCALTYYWPTREERKGPILPILDKYSSLEGQLSLFSEN